MTMKNDRVIDLLYEAVRYADEAAGLMTDEFDLQTSIEQASTALSAIAETIRTRAA